MNWMFKSVLNLVFLAVQDAINCCLYFIINTPQILLRRQINGKYRKCLLKERQLLLSERLC